MNFELTPMVKRLLIACSAITVAFLVLARVQPELAQTIYYFGALNPNLVAHGYLWQLVTYLFIHTKPMHLLFNMLGLYFLGVSFERIWGSKSFLRFILISGVGAGVAVVLVGLLVPAWNETTIGISGAITALLMAFAVMFPEQSIYFYGLLPVKGKHLVLIGIGLDVLFALAGSNTSLPAHLGGYAMGYLLVTGRWRPSRWMKPRARKPKSGPPYLKVVKPGDERYLH
jgi:membrane associated rhomboid family serine protease